MKIIAQVRLYPDDEQRAALKHTLEVANAACNDISHQAWQSQTFRRYDLQNLTYYDVRERFGLSAQQLGVCATAAVCRLQGPQGGYSGGLC